MQLLSEEINELFDSRTVALLSEYSVRTVQQFLSTKPEKLSSMLGKSYSVIMKIRKDIYSEQSSFPSLGIEEYQALLERELRISTGCLKLNSLLGSLQGGEVYEVLGQTGLGKTQLCLTAVAECLLAGATGTVTFIDTKGDFSADRLEQIITAKGGDALSLLQRVNFYRANSETDLSEAVKVVANSDEELQLLVVDNITTPLLRVLTEDELHRGLHTGCEVSHLLQRIAHTKGAVVLLVSNVKGGSDRVPALGQVWQLVANVRILLETEENLASRVSVVRGSLAAPGQTVSFTIDERGITDCE